MAAKIIFITGTGTGVGKTVLTGLLLAHLRASGCNALALKPFCSGSRADARRLRSLQENLLTLDTVNPFYFDKPVAPAAALPAGKDISLDTVLKKIRAVAKRCEVLLVEGSGGILVPLGRKFTVADLIVALKCPVFVAARNELGTINHTALTLKHLQAIAVKRFQTMLMENEKPDISARKNLKIIQKMFPTTPIFRIPNLGSKASFPREIKINAKYLQKILARILQDDIFISASGGTRK